MTELFWLSTSHDAFTSREHFMKLFVSNFHRQMLKTIEILASHWLRANLSVKISDKKFHEMVPRCIRQSVVLGTLLFETGVLRLSKNAPHSALARNGSYYQTPFRFFILVFSVHQSRIANCITFVIR